MGAEGGLPQDGRRWLATGAHSLLLLLLLLLLLILLLLLPLQLETPPNSSSSNSSPPSSSPSLPLVTLPPLPLPTSSFFSSSSSPPPPALPPPPPVPGNLSYLASTPSLGQGTGLSRPSGPSWGYHHRPLRRGLFVSWPHRHWMCSLRISRSRGMR